VTVELFLNHDCAVGHLNITQQMIECVAKMGQGKYTKFESPQDNYTMRVSANQILKGFIERLIVFTEHLTDQHIKSSMPEHVEEISQTNEIKEMMRKLESYDT
jgi:hypothetical protein